MLYIYIYIYSLSSISYIYIYILLHIFGYSFPGSMAILILAPGSYPALRHTELVSSEVSLTSWGGVCLALIGDPYSYGVTLKTPYGVDVLLH